MFYRGVEKRASNLTLILFFAYSINPSDNPSFDSSGHPSFDTDTDTRLEPLLKTVVTENSVTQPEH